VGSVAGEVSIPWGGAYCSSKHALRALSDSMRVEYLSAGVSVSLVEPGYVRSAMCDPMKEANCGMQGPETTTTPAYAHALLDPRPQPRYLVAHVGGWWMPANIIVPLLKFLPSRLNDMILLERV